MSGQYRKKKLWLLGPYATAIHWLFEFIILSALPVLVAGSIFAVTDLLTGGMLSHASSGFSLIWSVGQAVAIELLFFVSFMRVAQMAHQGQIGKMFGWLGVGAILAVPSFQAAVVYGQVHTFGITVQQAISQMGLSDMEWIVIRALAVIFIGALEGIAAYTPEGTQRSVEEQVAEMERKTVLAQASARMNAARGAAFLKAGKQVFKAAFTKEGEAGDEEEETPEEAPENVVQMPIRNRTRGRGGKRKKTEEEVKETVYRLLGRSPTMSLNEIAHRGKVSVSSASKYKNQWEAENGVERDARGRLKRTRAG